MAILLSLLFFMFCMGLSLALLALHIYGAYLCFCKKWYIGLAALVFGWFGIIVGAARYFWGKDILR